jgi:preprotein translocase subunit SecF
MFVVKHRNWFFIFSIGLVALSAWAFFGWGQHYSIEYTGGTIAEYSYASSTRPTADTVKSELAPLNLGEYELQPTGQSGYVIRSRFLSEADHQAMIAALSQTGANGVAKVKIDEKRFNAIGPTIGSELKRKALIAIVLVIICIVIFIAFAFRKVSEPVASWKYGIVAIIALVHDIAIPAGVFALLAHFRGAEIDVLFTTALLAVLGLSINDTIVVFDRIRENLRHRGAKETFPEVVGKSLKQTYIRSFNTSFTVILALLSLYIFGGDTTRNFALVLLFGMVAGTYSSIFLASPLLVVINNMQDRKKVAKK